MHLVLLRLMMATFWKGLWWVNCVLGNEKLMVWMWRMCRIESEAVVNLTSMPCSTCDSVALFHVLERPVHALDGGKAELLVQLENTLRALAAR
ncbi:hypothetical protein K443DRAFT_318716 [Laccaria amethystina LaAM-08-1]|uniref:Uncharacterized protein n=1 Tax=Laccaria amethystina LaAM-08-1 TaxID=1095629 RepID=A0A0C9XLQ8_9AGAR|nr:hypothetical protein K443DRAFT_318716 [Laccaria amethystina LaAM-08-1]